MKQLTRMSNGNHFVSRYRMQHGYSRQHAKRIHDELMTAGAVLYDFWLPESRSLPFVIDEDEHIEAVVYGRYADGTGALVATDKRVVFIDKKFLFIKFDDISYDAVNTVTRSNVGPYGTVILHTKLGDYSLKTLNSKAANIFCDYIETRCIDHNNLGVKL